MGDCNSFILSGLWGIDGRVLIVPSGIETIRDVILHKKGNEVLIVPSGIETNESSKNTDNHWTVLIVPSGIETSHI